MLKLKRMVGEVLLLDDGQNRLGIRLQKVESKRVTLSITTMKHAGEDFRLFVGDHSVLVHIEEATGRTSAVLAIDAPKNVHIWRAELLDRERPPERRARER